MFTIAGSGFGLYGYLPALIESLGEPVLLPEAYRTRIAARPELQRYLGDIRWVADSQAALATAGGIVIATTPRRQMEIVSRCCELPALTTLVLEKPVAPTPAMALDALGALRRSRKRFRIGYTLLHTDWGNRLDLRSAAPRDGEVTITWTFMAHHFAHSLTTWKREQSEGGGVLRFFGIHLVALLAKQGYRTVESSALTGENVGEPEQWEAVVSGPGLPACRVVVDSRASANCFHVAANTLAGQSRLVDLNDPFELEIWAEPGADRRIGVLKRLLDSFGSDDGAHYKLFDDVNALWQAVEDASTFSRRDVGLRGS